MFVDSTYQKRVSEAMPRVRGTSIERENPFRPGGVIEKETDELLKCSTISSQRVQIVDPSTPQYKRSTNISSSNATSQDSELDSNEHILSTKLDLPDSSNNNTLPSKDGQVTKVSTSNALTEETNGHTDHNQSNLQDIKLKKKKKKTCQII